MQTQTLSYTANGTELKGYLACADGEANPGVLVIHEWWGVNDYIRGRAEQLAGLGYNALAIDMYGNGAVAENPDEAGAMMNGVLGDMASGTARLQAGLAALQDHAGTDASRIAAIGYCFGGAMVLHMARTGMPLRAVVSFHGALGSFHKPSPGEVKARVLVCHGAQDKLIPDDDIAAFKAEMQAAEADFDFVAYPGALHGFTSREADANGAKYGLPLGYDESADSQSWQAMQKLLAESFA